MAELQPSSSGPAEQLHSTSKSILARITADELLELYQEPHDVDEMAELLGPTLNPIEKNRLKKSIWARLKRNPRYEARPAGEAIRRRKLGRLRINYIPKNRKTKRNGKSPVDQRWETVELRVANKSLKEICRLQMVSHPNVFMPLQKMGLTSGAKMTLCFSFGQTFDRASIRALYHASGLKTITRFAQETGVPFATVEPHLSPRNNGRGADLDTVRKLAEWRYQLFSYLMSNSSTGGHSPGQNRVLRTFFPDLKERYGFLRGILAQIGRKDSAWTREKLKIYLLEQAARGDKSIRQFLPWAVELMPFLEKKLEPLRGPHYQRLALQLIAEWLGSTWPTIAALTRPGCNAKPISPDEMRVLILEWRLARATELRAKAGSEDTQVAGNVADKKIGRPRKDDIRKLVVQLKGAGKSWTQVQMLVNRQKGLNLSVGACRSYAEKST